MVGSLQSWLSFTYASPSSTREGAGMGKTFNSCLNEHQIDCSTSPYEVDSNWFCRERFSKVWNTITKDRPFFAFKEDIFPLQLFPWFQRLVVLIFLSLSSAVTRLQSAQWHHTHTHTHTCHCSWLYVTDCIDYLTLEVAVVYPTIWHCHRLPLNPHFPHWVPGFISRLVSGNRGTNSCCDPKDPRGKRLSKSGRWSCWSCRPRGHGLVGTPRPGGLHPVPARGREVPLSKGQA